MTVALDTAELDKVLRGLSADGRDFEVLCRWFLLSDPVWSRELDEVWLWDDYPDRWGRDCGIDLVARRKDGTLIAVQAKNYGPATTITKADVDTFLSESARASITDRLLIGTTDRLAAAARSVIDGQDKAVATLLLSDLYESEVDWSSAHVLAPKPLPPLVPRPDQSEALAEIAAWAAAGGTRGKVVRACGTGKSLVAVLAADQLEARRVLVVTPGLGLLHQTEAVWARNATLDRRTLRICSSTSSDASVDTRERRLSERTTDQDRIAAILTRSEPLLVLCTYESSATLAKAIRKARGGPFDLVIADEAHRCAGPVTSNFRTLLSDNAIPAQRRLFFTATPAVFGTRDKAKAAGFSVQLASMDNEQLFGPVVHHLSFSEAVERQLLCRYQVAVIPIGSDEVDRLIQDRRYVHAGGPTHLEALELAVQVACARAMRDYGCRRIVSFHRTVPDSRRFSAHLPTAIGLLRGRRTSRGIRLGCARRQQWDEGSGPRSPPPTVSSGERRRAAGALERQATDRGHGRSGDRRDCPSGHAALAEFHHPGGWSGNETLAGKGRRNGHSAGDRPTQRVDPRGSRALGARRRRECPCRAQEPRPRDPQVD